MNPNHCFPQRASNRPRIAVRLGSGTFWGMATIQPGISNSPTAPGNLSALVYLVSLRRVASPDLA